jgi:cytochrome c
VRHVTLVAVMLLLSFVWSSQASAAGDATNGQTLFKQKCGLCHNSQAGQNRVGPSLFGVVGRKAGSVSSYNYSDAMKSSGLIWDDATLDSYLAGPRAKIPGTKMTFAGFPNDSDRADVIAYLNADPRPRRSSS